MSTDNPLLLRNPLPRFDAIRAEHVLPAITGLLARNRAQLDRLLAAPAPTFRSLIEPLEDSQHALACVWSQVNHLNAVMNSAALREAYTACLPLLSAWQTDLAQNEALCRACQRIAATDHDLDATQRRVLEYRLREFRLAGVALAPQAKGRFKELMQQLTQLSAKFEENILDATNAWSLHITDGAELAGINPAIIERARAAAGAAGGYTLKLEQPVYVAVMADADSSTLRRTFYEAWTTRASDQAPGGARFDNSTAMADILRARHELAVVLEFTNYADYALATRMAKTTDEVFTFLEQLRLASRTAAEQELRELEQFAGAPLAAWDINYWSERLQRERYSVSQEQLRPYFPLPRVLDGLFDVAQRLFGVRIVERSGVPVWHPDARYFEILDAAGVPCGSFYLDPCARANKRSGAWMDECVGRKSMGAATELPVAYLVCNFLEAVPGQPAQLTHDDVVTLFHEFGHGMHLLMTRVGYPTLAGINGVAWDAVELPSQFMENYAWHPQVLRRIALHVISGEPLPETTLQQLIRTRSFHAGLQMLRQLEFALFDFELHAHYDPSRGARVAEVLAAVRARVSVIAVPASNRFAHSFAHVFAGGYAAGYYSYKWAEVLAADAFAAFEEAGVFDRATAQRFVDCILSQGGSRDALEAFVAFRGRTPDVRPLLRQHGIAA
ncbi:MAG TPA: M3 family metallopeptidase [Steroidobacteraceae bacterium]|jgi:oligopeptidase A|nr:M3 family metallopeptidase [Steroidobacteraceae bacterium]